jgi:hypothetical protein
MLQHIHKVVPSNGVESLLYVKLEKKHGGLLLVEPSCQIPHIQEIFMNTSLLDEGTLRVGDKLVHVRGKAGGHHLGYNLGNGMYEAYWSKLSRKCPRLHPSWG